MILVIFFGQLLACKQ